ncbi:hypothetical protein J6590_108122, partial [Homalodisca vitripennis]
SEDVDDVPLNDDSECEDLAQLLKNTTDEIEEQIYFERCLSEETVLEVNDFVLVQFSTKKKVVMYVGQIEGIEEEGMTYMVKFLRKKEDSWKFYFPEKEDT